ncbi:MAG: hypothetical protein EPO20_12055 [Betaproteobacteria bacterium]|nr:MAG: hypothetical protein EPO20_12055 [Betaproteobacteria bacterium]
MRKAQWMRASTALVSVAAAAMALGCSPPQQAPAAAINDKFYTVTPDAMTVNAGILTGQLTEMKVMERVEEGSGRIDAPARLSGKLVLKNVSKDQSVRLVGGKVTYIDAQGQPIALEDNRTEPLLKFASSYGSSDRLDPGQDATQTLEVEFPVEALKQKKLTDIRLGLVYVPAPYKEGTLDFPVSIGGQ